LNLEELHSFMIMYIAPLFNDQDFIESTFQATYELNKKVLVNWYQNP